MISPASRRGQAEVSDVRLAVGVEHDIARLEIAVHDARGVGVGHGVGDLGAEFGRLAGSEPLGGEPFVQVCTLHEIANDKDRIAFAADLMHADDVRVCELGGCPGLAEEHLRLGRRELVLPRHLDCHDPIELGVTGFPDRSEFADADALQQLELPESLAVCVVDRLRIAADQAEAGAT